MRILITSMLLAALASTAHALEAFRIPGEFGPVTVTLAIRVLDEEGHAPGRVRVRIRGDASDFSQTFELELEGGARAIELRVPSGRYEITVYDTGHRRARRTFDVAAGRPTQETALELRLEQAGETAAPPPMTGVSGNGHGARDTLEIVRVFYATNRNATGNADASKAYGSQWKDSLSYGAAFVSIPRQHLMGRLERPSIFRFEFRENPKKHVVVQRVEPAQAPVFFDSVRTALGKLAEPRCLLYVHGYNVDFEGAMLRAGQMAYDLDLPVVPIAFTWPSLGKLSGYAADESTVELAAERVRDFMLALRTETGIARIDVITHSMGARAIGYALASLAGHGAAGDTLIDELILSAPDVDQRKMASWIEDFGPLVRRATLYGSKKDRALWLSGGIHNFPRAGDGGSDVFVNPRVETIDATAVPTDFISHTQPGDGSAVTADAYYVMRHQPVSARCCLRAMVKDGVTYWELVPRSH